jgi:alpha-tubulin suppressor-like RCC1 family protein
MSIARRVRWFAALAGVLALAAACAPPTAPPPVPLIECGGFSGDISYTPPATDSGADITITTLPGAMFTDCTDGIGAGITSGELDMSVVLPGYLCDPIDMGTPVGSGGGTIAWSDGSASTVTVEVFGGSGRSFVTEFAVTGGRWSGSIASISTFVTWSDGYCTPGNPVTRATLASDAPIAFHAPITPLLPPRTDLAQIDTGGSSCAVMTNGTVTCWGDNSEGQLGNVLFAPGSQASLPVPVTGLTGAAEVSVGVDHACARTASGAVRCWGNNGNGQLGNGTTTDSNVPVQVTGLTGAQQISVGYRRTCALLGDGTVRCWGEGAGPGGADSTTPTSVAGLAGVTQLTSDSFHHCALLTDDSVRCWGSNQFGQLGNGSQVDSFVPVPVVGLPPVSQVSAGGEHTCALDLDGEVWCWGFNGYGQLGQGSPSLTPGLTPQRVFPQLAATAIDAGAANTCALLVGGSVGCWGANSEGELGTGTTTDAARPMLVLGLRGAVSVSAGGHSCALLPGGRADCWGDNRNGQLGTGTRESSSVPLPVIDP